MKKTLLSLVFVIFASLAFSQTSFEVDGIHYRISGAGSNTVSVVTIFENPRGSTITIPSTTQHIENQTFYRCNALMNVDPNNSN